MSILTLKIIIIFLIITVALLGGYGAFKLKQTQRNEFYFAIGNTFAAGIFLGAGLIHMLPDADEGFTKILQSDFPFAPFIASLGFLLILFIEKIMVNSNNKTTSPYILISILSIHSIIVGIALGTEDRIGQSIIIAIAILAHKGSASFALAISMIKAGMSTMSIVKQVSFFSAMTPLGIVIGALIANILSGQTALWSIAVFDALAAGTFLYVAIMEIFNDEFSIKKDVVVKLLASTLGLLLMALLALWL